VHGPIPVVPVESLLRAEFWDVEVVHLPCALVVVQVPPLGQVVHVIVPIEAGHAHTQWTNSEGLITTRMRTLNHSGADASPS